MSENDGAGLLLSHRIGDSDGDQVGSNESRALKKLVGTQKLLPFHLGCLHFTGPKTHNHHAVGHLRLATDATDGHQGFTD